MEYYFIHKEWNDICTIYKNNHNIHRKNVQNEKGFFQEKNNKIIVKWNLWKDKD